MHIAIWGKHTHWNVYKCVHWYRQNIAQKKVIWYKKFEILSFRPKFHFLNYIFHIWRDPHAHRYMGKTYTLKRVQICPLVSSEYGTNKVMWYIKWEISSFRPKFHILNYILHMSLEPHVASHILKPYPVLGGVHSCRLKFVKISQKKVIWCK